MIGAVTKKNEQAFFALAALDPVFGSRMQTVYRTRLPSDNPVLWLQQQEKAICIIHLVGEKAIFCGQPVVDEELLHFLRFGGCKEVSGRKNDLEAFMQHAKSFEIHNLLLHTRDAAINASNISHKDGIIVDLAVRLEDVYTILAESFLNYRQNNDREIWLWEMSYRVRKGFSEIFMVTQYGRPVATAGVYSISEHAGLIESVATKIKERGKGYASLAVARCVSWLKAQEKEVWLISREETLPFYISCGFTKADEAVRLVLSEEILAQWE